MKKNIFIAITTYKRDEELKRLLDQINSYIGRYDFTIWVYSDGEKLSLRHSNYPNVYFLGETNRHAGKEEFWRIWDTLFSKFNFNYCKLITDYCFFIQDDTELKDNFFDEAIRIWGNINDDKKIALQLLADENRKGKSCWIPFKVKEYDEYYHTQWVDCNFMCEPLLIEALEYKINPIDKNRFKNKNKSSGVGEQISSRLHRIGLNMYQVKETLLIHGDHKSYMNEEERKINPLIAK